MTSADCSPQLREQTNLFENPDIVRDRECVPRVLVGVEIVVIIESSPCDAR